MNINLKLQLVTILPLIAALSAVLIVTQVEYQSLSEQTTNEYQRSVINHRKEELKNYIALAEGAINHVYQNPNLNEKQAQELVKQILNDMRFGEDGYYFAYKLDGTNLVLPNQQWRVGKNWMDMEDQNGVKIVKGLIDQAKQGGGYIQYVFNQPSKNGEVSKKLAYSTFLDKWQWMLGTGVYLDDIDQEVATLNTNISEHIQSTSIFTLVIGLFSIITIFITGLFIRFSERKLANKKLRQLNERIFQTQEEECKRVSRELHDGISQTIAAAKFSLETALLKQQKQMSAEQELERSMELISQIMGDIRSISHQLHPGVLEDYGLGAALEELARDFSNRTGIEVNVTRLSIRNILSPNVKTTLYRIAQEALTNVEKHANASKVNLTLKLTPGWLTLTIADNGKGFNHASYENSDNNEKRTEGIGLRNMKERLSFYYGELQVKSKETGTKVIAKIPQDQLRYVANNASETPSIGEQNV
ncbi:histidine kinase [Parashewanella curva]|uniref:histidine kinase n=1 Tax=Parashewanella curva TaxID=2338552 RepID=A0A3L8PXR6_9GAMM|nr:cache domain-containing protein [Parashewanella curva]RLV60094.1 histidine kinase [Parashewanella curva]